jgi:hypothetical protein
MTKIKIKARPTLYKGIQMRSRLEADYAALLDREDFAWEYEPTCFAADGVQWLPDFRITYSIGIVRYVEVKPTTLLDAPPTRSGILEGIDAVLRQMSVAWASEPNAMLTLAIHSYGRSWPDYEVSGIPGEPWTCADNLTPNAMSTIWPGMGQTAALLPCMPLAVEVSA